MKLLRFCALLLAVFITLGVSHAQDTWEWRSPSPTGNRISKFTYGHGLFVGVGENGTILTSPDGVTWTSRASGGTDRIYSIATDGTQFVAFARDNVLWTDGMDVLTSTDGIAWTRHTSADFLYSITFGNGVFVAFAKPAGVEWTDPRREIRTSTDGITWTVRQNLNQGSIGAPQFANGVFVVPDGSGGVITSSDGITWTRVVVTDTTGVPLSAAGNNRFLLCYGKTNYLSSNGTTWREVTSQMPGSFGDLAAVPDAGMLGFAGGYFYVRQSPYAKNPYWVYRSADGETWTAASTPSNLDFGTLASGGGVIVATEVTDLSKGPNPRSYFIHSSTDGISWTERTTILAPSSHFSWPVYGLGRYFFGGKSSNDGMNWADCGFEPTHAAGDRLFRIVSYSSGSAYADIIGWATTIVEVSSDGLTSAPVDVGMQTPRAVAYGNGRYVIVGDDGKIATSTDAINWTSANSGTTKTLRAVTFAFNRFAAAGDDGTFLLSVDGVLWSNEVSPGVAGMNFSAVAANSTGFVALTSSSPAQVPSGATSHSNVTVQFVTGHNFTSVVTLNDAFIAASLDDSPGMKYTHVWKSSDGKTWAQKTPSFDTYDSGTSKLAAGNGSALLAAPMVYAGGGSMPAKYLPLLQTTVVGSVPPTITHPPAATTAARGEIVSFGIGVTGSGPFSYQWYRGGTAIDGATKSVITLPGILDADASEYSVKVTNAFGSVTSPSASLSVTPPVPLAITQQPVGGTLLDRTSVILNVKVTGSGPIKYQWRRNGSPVYGGDRSTYEIYGYDIAKDSQVGTYDVVVTAPYSTVTSQSVSVVWGGPSVTIGREGTGPLYTGDTLILKATASGAGPFTYQWYKPGGNTLVGATNSTLILPGLTTSDTAPYWVEVTDANGQTARAVMTIGVEAGDSANHPAATAISGQDLTLRAGMLDTYNYRFQWRHNGQPIAAATNASYTIHAFSRADEGDYDVVVTAADGSTTVRSFISFTLEASRLANLSARGFAGSDEATLIQGFVLRGAPSTASPDILIRSIGPSLTAMGVNGVLTDPSLHILAGDHALLAENDNWSTAIATGRGSAATAEAMARFGAFPLIAGTRDSALLIHETPEGVYHTLVSAVGGGNGVVLNEIYGPLSGSQRLVNLSARARVGAGENVLIAGFVIVGKTPLKLLVRGVGPTLSRLGITQPLSNPKLTLFNSRSQEIHNNDNWGQAANAADIRTTAKAAGAFALDEGSNDASMLETLEPGVYTALVTSVDGSSGIALVEIYEAP